ncbi:MAG: hypothetical protein IJF69_03880 [Clostridia bacterium]|nr:hypothetical protein [Clostridia bacterium]
MAKFTLDISRRGRQFIIEGLHVGDNGFREFEFCFSKYGKHIVLPEGCTATLYAHLPGGVTVYDTCAVDKDRVIYALCGGDGEEAGLTSYAGRVECELKLICADGSVLTSPKFSLLIDSVLQDDEAIEAQSSFSALTDALIRVQAIESDYEDAIEEIKSTDNEIKETLARVKETEESIEKVLTDTEGFTERLGSCEMGIKENRDDVDLLKKQMEDLMYEEISITEFKSLSSTLELGSLLTTNTLQWKTSKVPSRLTLDGAELDPSLSSITLSDLNLKSNKSWTLIATDERGAESSKSVGVSFLPGLYYGVITSGSVIDDALIRSLQKSLRSSKSITFTVNAGEKENIIFALPSSYGTPVFTVGGFDGGFILQKSFDFTNASGHKQAYNVWLSENAGLGSTTVKVS